MLSKNVYQELFLRYAECSLDEEILTFKKNLKENFFSKVEKQFNSYSSYFAVKKRKTFLTLNSKTCNDFYSEIWISNDLRFAESNFYQLGFLKSTRATSLLSIIDFYWTEHLERMSYIRETINWRSYGQQTPLVEYNMEASKSFKLMLEQIRSCMIYYFLSNPIN
jgi:preprotein translocase subunit SecA